MWHAQRQPQHHQVQLPKEGLEPGEKQLVTAQAPFTENALSAILPVSTLLVFPKSRILS